MRRQQHIRVAPANDEDDLGDLDSFLDDVNAEVRQVLAEVEIQAPGRRVGSQSSPRRNEMSSPRLEGGDQKQGVSAWGQGGPRNGDEDEDEDEDFEEEEDIFGNGGKDRGDDHDSDDSDDSAEQIKFAHEVEDEHQLRDLEGNFDTLNTQLLEFREKYSMASEAIRERDDLKLKVEELEEEMDELQTAFEEEMADRDKASGGMNIFMTGMGARSGSSNNASTSVDSQAMEAEIRAQLMKVDDGDELSHMIGVDVKNISWKKRLGAFFEKSLPFRKDIRQVEAQFGTAVGAYLSFYRWIYMQFAVLFIVAGGFAIVHVSFLARRETFLEIISWNVMGDNPTYLMKFMRFQSFTSDEAQLYISVVIMLNFVLLINAIMKLVSEDQKRKRTTAASNDEDMKYAKFILGAWDNNLGSKAEADDLKGSLGQNLILLNSETRSAGAIRERTNYEFFILAVRRFWANVAYLITIVASGNIIIALQVQQKSLEAAYNSGVSLITIPGIAVTTLNSVTPTLLELITEFEKWDSGDMELRFLTFRTYLSSTINLGILVVTVLMMADYKFLCEGVAVPYIGFDGVTFPSWDKVRDQMGISLDDEEAGDSGTTPCEETFLCERMEGAAALAFSQVFTDSITKAFFFWVTGISPKIFSAITGSEWVKEEVKIAELTVANIFSSGLVMLTIPFAPLSLIFTPFVWAVNFKIEKWIIMNYYTKPKKEIRGGKSGTIFAGFYLTSVVIISLPLAFYYLNVPRFQQSGYNPEDDGGDMNLKFCTVDNIKSAHQNDGDDDGRDGMLVIGEAFLETPVLETFWVFFITHSYGAWFLVAVIYVALRFNKNSLKVYRESQDTLQKAINNQIVSLRHNLAKKEQTIKKLKAIGREDEVESDGDEQSVATATADATGDGAGNNI